MTLPRSRARSIHVGNHGYQWLASMHWVFEVEPDGQRWKKNPKFVDLHVEQDEVELGVLHARFPVPLLVSWGWQVRQHRRALPDDLVARTIRYAREKGWRPGEVDFTLPSNRVRFLRTPRHLLYTEPVIARIRVVSTEPGGHYLTTIHAAVIHPIRGELEAEFSFTAALPTSHIPEQALVFLHPNADGGLTTWDRYAGVFRISGNAVLIYDNSGRERRWGFRPLPHLLEELHSLEGGEE